MRYALYLLAAAAVLAAACTCMAVRIPRRPVHSRAANKLALLHDSLPPFETIYYDSLIDHFDYAAQSQQTFKMKVLVIDQYWDKNPKSPLFVYTGNEGAIELFYANSGEVYWAAQQFHALVIFMEHRYYGASLPFGSHSFDRQNLPFFSTDQALADYAVFLTDYKKSNGITGPVITFGGSYGGMLSIWFRLKYPHVVAGAVGASGPIAQFTDLTDAEAFNQKVTQDYTDVSPMCSKAIRGGFNVIQKYFNEGTASAMQHLQTKLKLCDPLNPQTDFYNVVSFYENIFTDLAMIDYPYPTNFLAPVPANPVNATCQLVQQAIAGGLTDDSLLNALNAGSYLHYNFTGETGTCYNITAPATPDLGDLAWVYQTCTEMPMPIGSDGVHDMFVSQPWDMNQWQQYCQQTFGTNPLPYWAFQNFGGRNLKSVKNIFFSNGDRDPWSTGGLLQQYNADLPTCFIHGGAHHLDLRTPNAADPKSCTDCRSSQMSYIQQWITEYWS